MACRLDVSKESARAEDKGYQEQLWQRPPPIKCPHDCLWRHWQLWGHLAVFFRGDIDGLVLNLFGGPLEIADERLPGGVQG